MPEKDTMQISALEALLSQGGDCVIVTHTRPDGDALGSATALCSYLRECRGLNASIVLPDSAPDNLSFILQGFEAVVASAQSGKAAGLISSCKLLFCLDFNAFPRAEGLQDLLAASHAEKILIDHHLNPDREAFKLCFSSCEVSSACEMLYSVLLALPDIGTDASRLPSRCRFALMAGMTTDTNNFANSVYPGTLRMASALLESGTDRDSIIDMLYKRDRLQKISAFADLLSSHMQILPGGIACIFMSSDMRKAYGLLDGETEGLVNIPLSAEAVKMSVFARTEGDRVRISLRSKPGMSANDFARTCFHGGGHELASGGKILIPEDISDESGAPAYITAAAARFLQSRDGGKEEK